MKVGVVGLGRVGLPLALVMAHHAGHQVVGYDLDRARVQRRLEDPLDRGERGLGRLLADAGQKLELADAADQVVDHDPDVVFIVVQTPHQPEYGGGVPMPDRPADFDYDALTDAYHALAVAAQAQQRRPVVAVVSTVLPGTLRRLSGGADAPLALVYNPAFIALGSVVGDLLRPDFILLGSDNHAAAEEVARVWITGRTMTPPFHFTGLESAELLKVALNAWLSAKIVFANTLAELADAVGADVDEVTGGLLRSHKVAGPFGLRAGLGDGGPCRPRDLIALTHLARRHQVQPHLFTALVRARESHTRRLAALVGQLARDRALPVVQLGWTYKPGSVVDDGAAARLLAYFLLDRSPGAVTVFDPLVGPGSGGGGRPPDFPAVYVLAVPHEELRGFPYPPGSVVVDPHGVVADPTGSVAVIRVGRR